jgi:hypothetical protein
MSELSNIFGGGAEHAHEQAEMEKVLPAPAPIAASATDDVVKDKGVSFPPIGLPGQAIVYEPFKLKDPAEDE